MLCSLLATPVASAQPADVVGGVTPAEDEPGPAQVIGYGALPGGLAAPSALTLPKGMVSVASLGGFGWRSGLLAENHRFGRGIGNLAVGFSPHELVSIALALDGRYDRHFGLAPSGEDGYVGDPRLIVRAAKQSGNLRFGGQAGVWVPGKDAPSIAGSAISFDVRGLVSLNAGPGLLSFSAGFRVDNSAKSVDNPANLTAQDRVSLGVSEFNAVIASAHLSIPFGKAFVGLESSLDLFVGSGDTPAGATEAHSAPGPLIRFGATAGYHVTPTISVLAFLAGAKVPGIDAADVMANDIKLVAYEPMITGGLGLQARFGGPKKQSGIVKIDGPPIEVIETADVSGEVVDDTGNPVVGAKVTVKLKGHMGTGVTDEKGVYVVQKLPIGKTVSGVTTLDDTAAEVSVEVDGKKPASQTLTLVKGPNQVTKLTLDPVLPPGQIRGLVRSVVTGRPLPGATIAIEPGGTKITSGADGTFTVDLPPGQYKLTASSPGLKEQILDVTVDPNGVAIKNIELSK